MDHSMFHATEILIMSQVGEFCRLNEVNLSIFIESTRDPLYKIIGKRDPQSMKPRKVYKIIEK